MSGSERFAVRYRWSCAPSPRSFVSNFEQTNLLAENIIRQMEEAEKLRRQAKRALQLAEEISDQY